MGYWGKIIGGTAGFFVGGPYGAVIGAALGHAADSGSMDAIRRPFEHSGGHGAGRVAGMLGRREDVFAVTVTVLAAKLCKCDGPVNRAEIDSFKRHFRIPPASARGIGRLFDKARDSSEAFEPYARQLAEAFSDTRGVLEQVLVSLFAIARSDGPLHPSEREYLRRVHARFGLDRMIWERYAGEGNSHARGGGSGGAGAGGRWVRADDDDPYETLGVARTASPDELRTAWKKLMRENHPDSLASRGVPADFIKRASEKVARINAAWDVIKRERSL
jgi:DnaJ like chaperone protein